MCAVFAFSIQINDVLLAVSGSSRGAQRLEPSGMDRESQPDHRGDLRVWHPGPDAILRVGCRSRRALMAVAVEPGGSL
jgi:hypothetical protein